ncbi:AmmeMemoRadiSam system protein B [bacterium]|nr:AmmeMemoRadiSam system protein B [bacterium]
MTVRESRFAGSWYPGERDELRAYLEKATPRSEPRRAIAVVCPHAGYRYSGAIAAETYARVAVPLSAIVLCPNHRVPPPVLAVWAKGSWRTPLGDVPIDEPLAARLLAEAPGLLRADDFPHEREHAVELQLPFLRFHREDVRVVPIVVGIDRASDLAALGAAIARAVSSHERPVLLVSSSDMNHYESAQVGGRKDRAALERLLARDAEGLMRVVDEREITMCGVRPTAAVLHAARALGASEAELVRYGHSGEVSGDHESVVGYAGVVIR